ncbi:Os08g0420900 [Oryza sativa Japonica Group]|uniref:Os08g0420900 protein n=1 Tax=Oryza sativa subsp. japonica TaxID=39947 RepID=C7J5Y6_ORYSJ|nr:Os08g0420900 [Oryza sativa Japonica Group]|eukprot:NP_001175582.1 Os08g0420900 [Oryza sativa Japonica Group]
MELSPATAATTRHLHLILAVAGYPPCHRTALQQPAGFIHDHTSPAYEIKGTNGHSCHHPPCSPHGFSSGGRIDGGKEARQRWICGRLRIAHIEVKRTELTRKPICPLSPSIIHDPHIALPRAAREVTRPPPPSSPRLLLRLTAAKAARLQGRRRQGLISPTLRSEAGGAVRGGCGGGQIRAVSG